MSIPTGNSRHYADVEQAPLQVSYASLGPETDVEMEITGVNIG